MSLVPTSINTRPCTTKICFRAVLSVDGMPYSLSARYFVCAQKAAAVEEDASFHFSFPDPGQLYNSGTSMIQLNDVCFQYPSARTGVSGPTELLFNRVSMCLDISTRMALVGANGAGKSTLIKLILGELAPTKFLMSLSQSFAGCVVIVSIGSAHPRSLLHMTMYNMSFCE
eukprot:4933792-Pyramimonas_sp.AAC.1